MTEPHEPDRDPDREHVHDDDAVFRQIVAGFGDSTTDPVPRWPVSEDVSEAVSEGSGSALGVPEELLRDAPKGAEEGLPGWLEPAALPDEGHYVPPPPPRLPRLRPRTLGALALLVAGFTALFSPYTVGLDDSAGSLVLAMVVIVGGVTLLLGSMRDAPGSDDRPDDGAVV